MDICFFLKGLIVILLTHHCKSEDLSSTLPSVAAPSQDGEASHKETPGEVVAPAVAPPSLREVEQAVQEATEQVEGGRGQDVLKELLERVVEAVLVEAAAAGGHEDKTEGAGQELAAEETGEAEEAGAAAPEQTVEEEEEVVGQDEEAQGEDVVVEGEVPAVAVEEATGGVEAAEVDVQAEAAEDSEALEEGAGEQPVEPAEVELGGPAEGAEGVIGESPVAPEVIQEVVEETVEPLEELGGQVTVADEAGGAGGEEEPEMVLEQGVAPEAEVQEVEQEETAAVSDPGPADAEQTEGLTGEEEEEVEESQGGEAEALPPPGDYESTQSVVGEEPTEEKDVVDVTGGDGAEGTDEETEQISPVVEGGAAGEAAAGSEEVVEAGEAAGGETVGGESVTEGEPEVPVQDAEEAVAVVGAVDQLEAKAGDEEQTAVVVPDPSQADVQDALADPAPEAADGADDGAATEQGSEGQDDPLSPPPMGGAEPGSNAMGGEDLEEEETNHANEIITSTVDLLPRDTDAPEPTLDNFVEELPATPPQSEEGGEPRTGGELVEDTAESQGSGELGLEAWKIGAISAAAFLLLETIFIVVYIIKCRKRTNSVPASERTCEEGCVEPEATTADCSDDTLPAGNGDTQQIAALDPHDVATALALTQQADQEQQAIAMTELSSPCSSPPGEAANAEAGTGSSPDVRTSVL